MTIQPPPTAVRQRALQQIPLRGSLQAYAPELRLCSGSALHGLPLPPPPGAVPSRATLPQRAPVSPVPHFPPAGLLLPLRPEALPPAGPRLLHHSLHPHRAQVQRPGQDGAARHLLSDGQAGGAGLHTPASSPARAPPSPSHPSGPAGLVPFASSSGDALGGRRLQGERPGFWRKGQHGPFVQERDGKPPASAESSVPVQQGRAVGGQTV